jgi:D-amino peptidase
MEGISGVVGWDETSRKQGGGDYERARKFMSLDVNAAALGAFDAGAEHVVINDSHGGMRNILVEELDERVRLISGSPKYLSMMQGVAGNDVAMLVGYHSRAHTLGIMNHTYTGFVTDYRINGVTYGECGMNAALAGHFGVPVILVTGDSAAAREAGELLPGVKTVIVKDPVSQTAANLIHPVRARAMIREGAAAAVREAMTGQRRKPFVVGGPVRLELTMARSVQADGAEALPGAKRVSPVTVAWEGSDYLECFRAFRSMMALAQWD